MGVRRLEVESRGQVQVQPLLSVYVDPDDEEDPVPAGTGADADDDAGDAPAGETVEVEDDVIITGEQTM